MKMKKRLLAIILWIFALFVWFWFAAEQASFEIIPSSSDGAWEIVEKVKAEWGHVRDNYKKQSQWNLSLWTQFASGVMTWDTILDYVVYLMKFLGQLALLVWAVMIIYLWYKKAAGSLFSKNPNMLWRIILWILVVSFSYVIIRMVWFMFIS